ncbi:glycoside hydrolase family 15 protein [Methanomethylovorans sp.]|uniref:glycoside hydrolase family 15 protein n=1 Tax=Methanomethylovorans sp. TaxID=2758717 RepID=UPI00351CA21C
MTRHIVLGNQCLLINIDKWLQVRDIYFPHVGQENHLLGHAQRVGVYVDGNLSWINEPGWERKRGYRKDVLISDNRAVNKDMGVEIVLEECVHSELNIFLRKVTVRNLQGRQRELRLFFNQDFHIYGNGIGDTAIYQMNHNVIVHYKNSRYFLIGALKSNIKEDITSDIDDFAIGQAEEADLHGTFRDAEDGALSKNPVAQGTVDSTIGVHLEISGNSKKTLYYYMTAGMDFKEIYELNDFIMENGPERVLEDTEKNNTMWLSQTSTDLSGLDQHIIELYRRSLLVIKTQTDRGGAILAANDSDNMQFNRDTYSYMWTRDGALVAIAMIRAGYPQFTRPFFIFCRDVIWWAGCMLHKYNPDGTLGSSWHPWVEVGKPSLPIQEDETALVIHALWQYYEATRDIGFVKELYEPLVKKAAFFMNSYRYPNELPRESYDLWEERRGIFTFTASVVYAGLTSGERLADLFNDHETCTMCRSTYLSLKGAIIDELYDPEKGIFLRGINYKDGNIDMRIADSTVDSSVYAIFDFNVLPADDSRVERTMMNLENKLWINPKGGLARYENDHYHRQTDAVQGNPWIICTLWLARWYIAKAKDSGGLERPLELIRWVANCTLETGIMPEQVHPFTEESLSVAPLTWSHAEFVDTVTKYIEKQNMLST